MRIDLGQLDLEPDFSFRFQRRSPTRTPASTRGLSSSIASSKRDEFPDPLVGAVSDHERQVDVPAVTHLVDHRAVGRDRA